MSTAFEDIRQMEPVPEHAGLFSWFKKLKFRRAQPKAAAPIVGSPEAVTNTSEAPLRKIYDAPSPETDAYGRKEPVFTEVSATKGPAVSETLKTDLLGSIARIWQQETVDPAAFARVKGFKIEPPTDNIPGTMTLVNDDDDAIYFGINPDNGMHAVMSASNISARHALDQVYVALTDDLMRAEGVDDVEGTDLDKALLCLAAEKNGLKINNMPALSDEVKAQARKLWQETFPEEMPVETPEKAQALSAKNTPTVPDVPAIKSAIKPAAMDILRGDTAEDSVAPETFQTFVTDLKSGKFSDDQGMLAEDDIRAIFNRKVGNGTEADIILRAAEAQGVVYGTTKAVPALRMLVNPHVESPVRYDPNKPKLVP